MTKCIQDFILDMDEAGIRLLEQYVGNSHRILNPDLIIAPDGNPYLFRWYLTPHDQDHGNIYFHLQVASDPERPLHDHPWPNFSNILRGGYDETLQIVPPTGKIYRVRRLPGQVVFREAREAHHLRLPEGVPYTMSLFSTGKRARQWGFWYPEGWVPFDQVTCFSRDGKTATHIHRPAGVA